MSVAISRRHSVEVITYGSAQFIVFAPDALGICTLVPVISQFRYSEPIRMDSGLLKAIYDATINQLSHQIAEGLFSKGPVTGEVK